ncbi:ADP-ribosylation factor-like protein 2-binding protein [Convolutriloba macropyga]|uniref:ADP-ribosylation factor-like protein 2-binding protein n=1 Tax=Convolutriloba macropyga TaxID=536237 RepID=UPI003F5227B7
MANQIDMLKLDLDAALQDDVGNGDAPFIEEEEVLISNNDSNNFNIIIGCLEEIVMSDAFQSIQKNFMDKYYKQFADSDENKLEYTGIFNEYVSLIEIFIEKELKQDVPDFNMQAFLSDLPSRQDEIDQELFNILLSFTDFVTFKSVVLEYKREQEGTALDFGDMLLVNGQPATPRTAAANQSLAAKLGLNFGPVCQGPSASYSKPASSPSLSSGSANRVNKGHQQLSTSVSSEGDQMDIETTPAVQYENGAPIF